VCDLETSRMGAPYIYIYIYIYIYDISRLRVNKGIFCRCILYNITMHGAKNIKLILYKCFKHFEGRNCAVSICKCHYDSRRQTGTY